MYKLGLTDVYISALFIICHVCLKVFVLIFTVFHLDNVLLNPLKGHSSEQFCSSIFQTN